MMRASILSTGNELLYGKTIDTNGGFIGSRLFPMDIAVKRIMETGDSIDDLERSIRYLLLDSDILIMTGGLGPTDDDNTIEALRRIFDFEVNIDDNARRRMEAFFEKIGMAMTVKDLKMAEVPAGALVLDNEKGLAPGFIMCNDDKLVISMPGVPREAEHMMVKLVVPYLKSRYGIGVKKTISLKIIGVKESDINESIKTSGIPLDGMEWGMTAEEGITTLTFVDKDGGFDIFAIPSMIRQVFPNQLLDRMWDRPEEEVIDILRKKDLTMAIAESCTGGLIAKRITDISGSSDVFTGGIVSYANDVKVRQLGVLEETLSTHGAVSSETAAEMAAGVRIALRSSIGISTTGIAGPGGGSESKPVGTVWFGLADEKGVKTFTRVISGDRERVRSMASLIAVENLRSYLKHLGAS
ncbi:MAG: CinA family nicotinamide mononucleotide deamidase-related protein [Spirochaetes bacterium]|nr:CinA family nicotinamide mononucleotide deamidase-related protein [Spirochaetota bacterium]